MKFSYKIVNILLIILISVIAVWFFSPKLNYYLAVWSEPCDTGLRKFQFCKYDIPKQYKMVAYRDHNNLLAKNDNKVFILFKNKDTGQYFAIFRLNEVRNVDLRDITFSPHLLLCIAQKYLFNFRNLDDFTMEYYFPRFINKDLLQPKQRLDIEGISEKAKGHFETDKADIIYREGYFKDLAFHRISPHLFRKHTVPVFKFKQKMCGIVSVIKDKKTGDTIYSFGCGLAGPMFDKKEYLDIIRSVSFDAEPVPEMWEREKRREWEKMHLPKKDLSKMSQRDIRYETTFLQDFNKAEEIEKIASKWEDCEDKIIVYNRIAELYEKRGLNERAFALISDTIRMHTELKLTEKHHSFLYTRLASLYLHKMDYANVEGALKKAAEIDPENPMIYYLYGVMADFKREWHKAIEYYEKFLTYRLINKYEMAHAKKRIAQINQQLKEGGGL